MTKKKAVIVIAVALVLCTVAVFAAACTEEMTPQEALAVLSGSSTGVAVADVATTADAETLANKINELLTSLIKEGAAKGGRRTGAAVFPSPVLTHCSASARGAKKRFIAAYESKPTERNAIVASSAWMRL